MEKLIKELILEGKTDAEIAEKVLLDDSAKDITADEIAVRILEAKKAQDVTVALAKAANDAQVVADQKLADDEAVQKMKDIFEDKLKSLHIDPAGTGSYGTQAAPKLKTWNAKENKMVEREASTEAYLAFNDLLSAGASKDFARAKGIEAEINQDNLRISKSQGKTANDATTSDVSARGGYTIPTEVDAEIALLLYQQSVMMSVLSTDNVIFQSKIYPTMYNISTSYIADQDTAVTESQPAYGNPTVSMKRFGAFSNISNTILRQKGADLVAAFVASYSAAVAQFIDFHSAIGNVTGASELVDGIAFDTNTNAPTAFALSALTLAKLADIKNALSEKCGEYVWIANRKVSDKIGLLENTAGTREFPGYIEGRPVAPFGGRLITNSRITSVLGIGEDNNTGGSDDVLLCVDPKQIIMGISPETRIEFSSDFRFTHDQTVIRGIKEFGQKVLHATGTAGIVAIAQELTN